MTRLAALLVALLLALPAAAEIPVPGRTLRAGAQIGAGDLVLLRGSPPPGTAADALEVVGLEARVTLFAGRPIPLANLAPPALVERNQIVALVFRQGGLEIRAEGRSLGRAGAGESVRIMNLSSRSTVSGLVAGPGLVVVGP